MRSDTALDQEFELNGHDGKQRQSICGKGLATIGAWLAAAVVMYGLWTLSLPTINPDNTCGGIGLGCSITPRDGALFIGVFVGVPLLTATAVVAMLILALLSRTKMRSGVWAGTVAALGGLVVTTAAAAALYLPSM